MMLKKQVSSSPPKNKYPTAIDLHKQWKRDFLSLTTWEEYDPEYPFRKYGLSRKEKKEAYKTEQSFESELIDLCLKYKCNFQKINSKSPKKYKVKSLGVLTKFAVDRVLEIINANRKMTEDESKRAFMRFIHENRHKGKSRSLPSFIAEFALLGLSLHPKKKSKDKEKTERELIKEFFKMNGEFYDWYVARYGKTDALFVLCSIKGDEDDITAWTKQFKATLRSNIFINGEKATTAQINKLMKEKSKRIIQKCLNRR